MGSCLVESWRNLSTLELGKTSRVLFEKLLKDVALRLAVGLALRGLLKCCNQLSHIVGEQACLGITNHGCDARGLPRNLGLLAERLQLTTNFAGKVVQAGEVCLHCLELALGLFFATTVLENSGSLFDEPTALLRCRLEDAVELPLSHDDVHLASQSGVAEQFLHVEQSTCLTVDGVFTAAVAKQRSAYGYFAVVDRERTIRVIDG